MDFDITYQLRYVVCGPKEMFPQPLRGSHVHGATPKGLRGIESWPHPARLLVACNTLVGTLNIPKLSKQVNS